MRIPVVIPQQPIGKANPAAPGYSPLASSTTAGGAYSLEQTGTRQGNRTQTASRQAASVLRALPFADGNLTAGVTFGSGATVIVQHKLGRAYQGFLVLNMTTGGGRLYSVANASVSLNDVQITLRNAGDVCQADVWVY